MPKPNFTQDLWWQNLFNRTKRRLAAKTKVAAKPTPKRNNSVTPSLQGRGRNLNRGSIIKLAIPLVAVLLVIIYLLNAWFRLAAQPLNDLTGYKSLNIYGERNYIAAYIYERINGFEYIDALALLQADYQLQQMNVTFVSTDFYTRTTGTNYIQVRNILSNAQAAGDDRMLQLTNYLQNSLGLPVDRYIAIEKNNFLEMLDLFGVGTYRTIDEFSDSDAGTFKLNKTLTTAELVKYLAADAAGFNRKMIRASNLSRQLFIDAGTWQWWQAAINSARLSELIQTDLSRSELYALFNLAISTDRIQSIYISTNESLLISTRNGNVIVPSSVQVDEKTRQIYSRQNVVREQARIEIYNASRENGLATNYRRRLSNHGANVIRAGNFADQLVETTLYVPNATNYPENIRLIREMTRDKVIIKEEAYPFNHTAELVLVLGTSVL